MFSLNDIRVAKEIVSHLHLPDEFGTSEYQDTEEVENMVYMQLKDVIDGDFDIRCGVSKLVIVLDEYSFVIKIPFNGQFESWEDDDGVEHEDFREFEMACDDEPDDYCYDELEKITAIKQNGFGDFAPEMEYLTQVDGFSIYIQEKVKTFECITSTEAMRKRAKEENSDYHYGPLDWRALIMDFYGENYWERFVDWCKSYFGHTLFHPCEVLTDLHSGNVGVRYDGRPVILDLSGYRDC